MLIRPSEIHSHVDNFSLRWNSLNYSQICVRHFFLTSKPNRKLPKTFSPRELTINWLSMLHVNFRILIFISIDSEAERLNCFQQVFPTRISTTKKKKDKKSFSINVSCCNTKTTMRKLLSTTICCWLLADNNHKLLSLRFHVPCWNYLCLVSSPSDIA